MSYNFAGLKEAFVAAVESSVALNNSAPSESTEAEAVGEEDSFLRRLHFHSARLSESATSISPNISHFSLFSSSNGEPIVETIKSVQETESNGFDDDGHLTIGLSPSSVAKLNTLFGDGQTPTLSECSSSCEVNLPIWLCEFLFKAIQKMPISNSLREEFELQDGLMSCILSSPLPTDKFRKEDNTVSLRRLYEMFPTLSRKVVKRVAREKDFNIEQTAHYLIEFPDDDPSICANDEQSMATHSVIVPSLRPRVITTEEQQPPSSEQNYTTTANANLLLLPPDSWDNELQDVEKELRRMETEQRHCKEMKTKYFGCKNSNIFGFYSLRANELEMAKKAMAKYWDRLRIWRTSCEECIDLHEMGAERALSTVVEKINICREKHPNIRKLHVITGYGKTTGTAVIKPRLIAFLKGKGIEARVSPKNQGVVEISLGGICQHIPCP